MNRRSFSKSLAALGLAPALPQVAASSASATATATATATAAAPAYTPYMFGLGAHAARKAGRCTPEMLMQRLRIGI